MSDEKTWGGEQIWDSWPPVTAQDHTHVMQEIIDRPLHVVQNLRRMGVTQGSKPAPEQILDAALQVRSFDERTRSILLRGREAYPELVAAKAQLPAEVVAVAEDLMSRIADRSVEETIAIVAEMRAEQEDPRLKGGFEFAEEILRDGADSIYAEDEPGAELLFDFADGVGKVVGADVFGAVQCYFYAGIGAAGLCAAVDSIITFVEVVSS